MDGKIGAVGPGRTLVLDVIRYAKSVPSFPVERAVNLRNLVQARHSLQQRVSWTAILTRAYGLASRRHSVLRQIFVSWPWPRIYQSPQCVIAIAINRSKKGESDRLFFGRIASPDQRSLMEIQSDLDRFQTHEPAQVFRSQWRAARLPALVRRLGWWWRMDVDYRNRARRCGTGSISALAGLGVTNRLHPCIMTSSFSFGPIDSRGDCLVTLQCDHRVIDGVAAAEALNTLCRLLNEEVLAELRDMASSSVPSNKVA